MPAFVPNKGEETLMKYIRDTIHGAPPEKDVYVRLYTNDYTPVAGSLNADFTEATFKGYAAVDNLADNWAAPALNGNGYVIIADQVLFAYDSGEAGASSEDVYGFWLVDEDDNILAAERFAGAPFEMSADGHEVAVTPKLKLTEITEACA